MKFFKKGIATLAMVGMMCVAVPQNVEACDKTSTCDATKETVTCGHVQGYTVGHSWTADNGHVETCGVTIVSGPHTITCSGCGAFLREESRKCSEVHSNKQCPYRDRTNICQQ